MKAFVKVNNGTFPNLNFYLAWEAFNTLGYSVTLFEEKDIETLDITTATPVFAGVQIFRKVIDKLGINYPPFDCYPTVLNPYYGRNLRRSTLGEERAKFNTNPIPVFVKPVLPKQFIGNVWNSILNLIPLAKIHDSAEVWVCEPIDIVSEFRVYVNDGDILGVKHYFGDWSKVPSKDFIKEVVKVYHPCPIAYGVDVGVKSNGESFVIEANDGCNLGNYGLDSIHYGEMIVARWFEIMADHGVSAEISKLIADQKEHGITTYTWSDGTTWTPPNYEKYYNGPAHEGTHHTGKELHLKPAAIAQREKSMKAFAEDVMKRLKEGEEHA
jgi:hypothetical protein